MSVFLISLLISVANGSEAKDCSERDLRSRFGKVRDQSLHWCYAFSVADLFSEANSLSPSNPVSPLDVGVTYISAQQVDFDEAVDAIHVEDEYTHYRKGVPPPAVVYSGRHPDKRQYGDFAIAAALYLRRNRLCTEGEAPTMDDLSASEPVDFVTRLLGTGAISMNKEMTFLQRVITLRIEQFRESTPIVAQCRRQEGPVPQTDLVKTLNNLAMEKLKHSLDQSCKGSKSGREVQIHSKSNSDQSFIGRAMKLLDRGRPFEIGYNFCELARNEVPEVCLHSSIVVGRKYEAGVCQFLVRNSHGKNCKQFEGLNVNCAEDSPGYFWVDKDLLNRSVSEYNWLENDKEFFTENSFKKISDGF